jgi:CRISPR-associated endonuclease/helicase Cas3
MQAAGKVIVFRPEIDSSSGREYPTNEYERAAEVTEQMLREAGLEGQDGPQIFDPKTYAKYFSSLISQLDTDAKQVESLRHKLDFPKVAAEYRLIEDKTQQVIVPFSPDGNAVNSPVRELLAEARYRGFTMETPRRLQPFLVNLWPHEFMRALSLRLVAEVIEGWWEWTGRYDIRCGLMFEFPPLPPV